MAKTQEAAVNALAVKALEAIKRIDEEAKKKKEEQIETLRAAKGEITKRITELLRQEGEIDKAIAAIKGKPAPATGGTRGSLSELRGRIVNWLNAHKGEKYSADAIRQQFPELEDRPFSVVMTKELEEGTIKSEGKGRGKTYHA